MVDWILGENRQSIIQEIENKITEYGLEKAAKEPFDALREAYNKEQNPLELYVLHMYAFQNMIRFNGSHKFNTPIGVAGYSDDIKQRILNFNVKAPEFELLNKDYVDLQWDSFPEGTVFYFDPPYYITSAAYNDGKRGMKGWGENEEKELLDILSKIDEKGYSFILSNVLYHKDKENHILLEWIKKKGYRVIDIGTSGWRYTKNEVLVVNY